MGQNCRMWILTVICKRANHANYKSPTAYSLAAATWTVVSMFPEDTSVFLVDADHVLDNDCASVMSDVCSRLLRCKIMSLIAESVTDQIVNLTQAVASQG
jgi:hypothetical protein